jgi:hypothetical protein
MILGFLPHQKQVNLSKALRVLTSPLHLKDITHAAPTHTLQLALFTERRVEQDPEQLHPNWQVTPKVSFLLALKIRVCLKYVGSFKSKIDYI